MAIRVVRSKGCYDFLHPRDVSIMFGLMGLPANAPAHSITETCEEGSEFDPRQEDDPFEVLDLLERRVRSYLLMPSRDEVLSHIQWVRDNRARIERDWIDDQIIAARAKRDAAERELDALVNRRDFLEEEAEAALNV